MRRAVLTVAMLAGAGLWVAVRGLAAPGAETWASHGDVKPLALPPQLPVASGYTTVDAFPLKAGGGLTFSQPLDVIAAPNDASRVFVVEKTGQIQVVTNLDGADGPKKSVFLDVAALLKKRGQVLGQTIEWGVLGLAFHPDYAKNGYFYVTYNPVVTEDGKQIGFDRVARFSVSKTDPNVADPDSEVPLITMLDELSSHNGGCVRFGTDGYLYTNMGDEGAPNDTFDNARYIDKDFFAAILRIDVDKRPGNVPPNPHAQPSKTYPSAVHEGAYLVPSDNPFIGLTEYFGTAVDPKKVRTEMYANGVRNPFRFNFDPPTGRLFVADVGQELFEEVDIVEKGKNYGWSYRESLHDGPRVASTPAAAKFADPIYEYKHPPAGNRGFGGRGAVAPPPATTNGAPNASIFQGGCISGGFVYRGTSLPELSGAYVFGDYVSRRVWSIREKDGKWTPSFLATTGQVVSISPDPRNGDVLLCDLGSVTSPTGKIRRLVRTGVQGPPPPALLSQVGAFKDLKTLTPAEGLLAYEPNVTFWSDYAIKQRWFIIPNGADKIGFSATGNWTFPAGTVWVKHFEMEMRRGDAGSRRRLETRFLVKSPASAGTPNSVYGITYRWRPDGSDADLVSESGQDETLDITLADGSLKKQTWHYPSQSECLTCHTEVAGGALAFNTFQLNGVGGGAMNQINALSHAGYFTPGTPVPATDRLPAYAKADDASAPLEWRVRSYFAVNCVQCHQPGGVAQGQWDARPTTALESANIVNGTLVNTRGDAAARAIVPGDLVHSMVLRRIEAKDAPRMPPLASNELDPNARALLAEWISQLKK